MHAVFLSAIFPKTGPYVIAIYPEDILTEDERVELSLKCMPMGGKEGDFSSIVFKEYQVAAYLTTTAPIDEEIDSRDTIVSIGFLLNTYTNPIPYRNLLLDFVKKCKKDDSFNLSNLEKVLPEFIKLKTKRKIKITLDGVLFCEFKLKKVLEEKNGLDLIDEALWDSK